MSSRSLRGPPSVWSVRSSLERILNEIKHQYEAGSVIGQCVERGGAVGVRELWHPGHQALMFMPTTQLIEVATDDINARNLMCGRQLLDFTNLFGGEQFRGNPDLVRQPPSAAESL